MPPAGASDVPGRAPELAREICGRVVARPSSDTVVVVDATRRARLRGAVEHLLPGDLVRIRAVLDDAPDGGVPDASWGSGEGRAERVELVFRPLRAPWAPGTETAAVMGEGLRERLERRAAVVARVRAYFQREGFLEVDTPAVATSPGLDLHLHAFSVHAPPGERGADRSGSRPSFPGGAAPPVGYLITSPEYHMKRLLVGGITRCFQLARCFRASELGRRHEPEFTMLEWYRAWDDLDALLTDTEAVVRAAADADALVVDGARVRLDRPFERLTVREAFARYAPEAGDPIALAERDEERFFQVLVERVEPRLGRERPTFLSRYPASQASLARLAPDDPSVCERVELYVHGVELSNGFVELTDPVEQRARLERDQRERAARGLPVYPIDERFLHALAEGLPPSVGNALGLDRLVALVSTGQPTVADVMAFPVRRR